MCSYWSSTQTICKWSKIIFSLFLIKYFRLIRLVTFVSRCTTSVSSCEEGVIRHRYLFHLPHLDWSNIFRISIQFSVSYKIGRTALVFLSQNNILTTFLASASKTQSCRMLSKADVEIVKCININEVYFHGNAISVMFLLCILSREVAHIERLYTDSALSVSCQHQPPSEYIRMHFKFR